MTKDQLLLLQRQQPLHPISVPLVLARGQQAAPDNVRLAAPADRAALAKDALSSAVKFVVSAQKKT
ncbi:MAG: hypothetical protein PHH28_05840 [Desulfuromonadaceae bacterium]|nr:hypothetical protein [Desulfuromonadaceae bacterium]